MRNSIEVFSKDDELVESKDISLKGINDSILDLNGDTKAYVIVCKPNSTYMAIGNKNGVLLQKLSDDGSADDLVRDDCDSNSNFVQIGVASEMVVDSRIVVTHDVAISVINSDRVPSGFGWQSEKSN